MLTACRVSRMTGWGGSVGDSNTFQPHNLLFVAVINSYSTHNVREWLAYERILQFGNLSRYMPNMGQA